MPRASIFVAACLTAVLALLASGCAPAEPTVISEPAPSVSAPFAADEEAFEAAKEAYRRYLAELNAVLSTGGANPERLPAVATGKALEGAIRSAKEFSRKGWKGVGEASFDSAQLQSYDRSEPKVTLYLCEDLSKTDVVDSNGSSVAEPGRTQRLPLVIEVIPLSPGNLAVTRDEIWDGRNFCLSGP